MRAAVLDLTNHPQIDVDFAAGLASLYETSPVLLVQGSLLAAPQPPYLNSAVRLTTTLSPAALLKTAFSIEAALGRTRRQRWEPRVIDIDLLLYDDLVTDDDGLTLPHPRLHERRFVLEPLAEIAAGLIHPVLQVSIEHLNRRQRRCEGGPSHQPQGVLHRREADPDRERLEGAVALLAGPQWVWAGPGAMLSSSGTGRP
jgi:2-amino-4-hydroxy-6-hydroxymethyldihydropteridine diphosphokinase